jgi:hypothetical protein
MITEDESLFLPKRPDPISGPLLPVRCRGRKVLSGPRDALTVTLGVLAARTATRFAIGQSSYRRNLELLHLLE